MKAYFHPAILTVLTLLGIAVDCVAFYDPTVGRWASRDPIEEHGGHAIRVFVRNSPMNYTDLLGLKGQPDDCVICKCGPDVTDAIRLTLLNISRTFAAAAPNKQKAACQNLIHPVNAWDSLKWTPFFRPEV